LDLIVDDGSRVAVREALDPELAIDSLGAAPRTRFELALN